MQILSLNSFSLYIPSHYFQPEFDIQSFVLVNLFQSLIQKAMVAQISQCLLIIICERLSMHFRYSSYLTFWAFNSLNIAHSLIYMLQPIHQQF
ncbi:hypothetical protein FGO68_gene6189 [Halteria grandinella]|uniref:Uncharacterized protein n=1 Tax=Halteria grandinella TaxID=5974 RepID=A0A8J8T2Z2_HALGN|nr:hypothetical protein FGO68_gene6189 [Halteria grandinella]